MFRRILNALRPRAGARPAGPAEIADRESYRGLELQARPIREGELWRVAGRICRAGEPDGPRHDFIRVDTMASHDEAVRLSLMKARLIVDERGDAVLGDD
ncbi:MAG: HlyU family transcriptional regulator [Halofilum sp. (in: g-proteobacteria)]|nr:HlyU family transcriptional regulator [Halofilum sp. (in: g-proteobacteria)]